MIKTVGETNVSYQVTADGGAGLVSARDFVYGNKSVERGGRRVMGGCSVVLDSQPEVSWGVTSSLTPWWQVSKVVRAVHGPGLQMVEVDGEGCRSYRIPHLSPVTLIHRLHPHMSPQPVTCHPNHLCRYTWLMDCDYRGMIPGSVMELAMPHAQLQVILGVSLALPTPCAPSWHV